VVCFCVGLELERRNCDGRAHTYIVKSALKEYDFYQQFQIAYVTQQATRATGNTRPDTATYEMTKGRVSQSGFFVSYNSCTEVITLCMTSSTSASLGNSFCCTCTTRPVTMRMG
jgi:hypothetical protein